MQLLSDRKRRILRAVVHSYTATAEPVGSRTVARTYRIGISSATIRNEMADLEEMGYLEQPHTSAGRIPSDRGYRYYVDYLMEEPSLDPVEARTVVELMGGEKILEIERIILNACRALSSITNHTALIMGPQFRKSAFHQMRILPLSEKRGLVVLITDTGFIKNKVIDLPHHLNQAELHQVVNYLNQKLYGLTIDQVTSSLVNELKRDLFRRLEILEQAFVLLEESIEEEEQVRVYLGGTTNILNQPEFKNVDKIRQLLALFEQEQLLCQILESGAGGEEPAVFIGRENAMEDIQECTLITAAYKINEKTLGTIGILGPTRMAYRHVIGAMRCLVKNLNYILSIQR